VFFSFYLDRVLRTKICGSTSSWSLPLYLSENGFNIFKGLRKDRGRSRREEEEEETKQNKCKKEHEPELEEGAMKGIA
jgi:hypothetical protein